MYRREIQEAIEKAVNSGATEMTVIAGSLLMVDTAPPIRARIITRTGLPSYLVMDCEWANNVLLTDSDIDAVHLVDDVLPDHVS